MLKNYGVLGMTINCLGSLSYGMTINYHEVGLSIWPHGSPGQDISKLSPGIDKSVYHTGGLTAYAPTQDSPEV